MSFSWSPVTIIWSFCSQPCISFAPNSLLTVRFNLERSNVVQTKSFFSHNLLPLNMLCKCIFWKQFHHSIETPYVIIEYVPYGDLLGYLRRSRGLHDCYYEYPEIKPTTNLTSEQIITFAWQIADGMQYISSKRVRVFNWELFMTTSPCILNS